MPTNQLVVSSQTYQVKYMFDFKFGVYNHSTYDLGQTISTLSIFDGVRNIVRVRLVTVQLSSATRDLMVIQHKFY